MRFALLFFALPGVAFAHTKWFAEGELTPLATTEPTALYLTAWALIAALILAVGIYLERHGLLQLDFLHPHAGHAFPRAASAFSMIAGAFFIIAGFYGYLFSPNVTDVPQGVLYAEILIGLAFVIGFAARVAALVLFALWLLGFAFTDFITSFENIWVASTALFIAIMGNDYFSLVKIRFLGKYVQHLKSYALPILRIGAGGALLTLGFSEKILHPEFGVHFLTEHPWNFMALLGVPFSNYLFTLSAGAVESLFGLIFILGVVTRLNALVVAVFFSIPLLILGPIELTGHVPHFAAVALLLLFGSGPHWKIAGK